MKQILLFQILKLFNFTKLYIVKVPTHNNYMTLITKVKMTNYDFSEP